MITAFNMLCDKLFDKSHNVVTFDNNDNFMGENVLRFIWPI